MTAFIDLNLRAEDKTSLFAALAFAGFIENKQFETLYHPTASLQLLPPGTVTHLTGAVQAVDGVELEMREAVPGYHANVRTTDATLAAALAPVAVSVGTPQYVWAG